MTPFARFARPLQRAGFRKTWSTRSGGGRMTEWRREEPDGRTLVCQIWEDGQHRISHEWLGCSDTHPTDFETEAEMAVAVEHEATRTDGTYRDPDHHHPAAREILLAKRAALS